MAGIAPAPVARPGRPGAQAKEPPGQASGPAQRRGRTPQAGIRLPFQPFEELVLDLPRCLRLSVPEEPADLASDFLQEGFIEPYSGPQGLDRTNLPPIIKDKTWNAEPAMPDRTFQMVWIQKVAAPPGPDGSPVLT